MINGIPTLAYRGVNAPNPPNFMSFNRRPGSNDTDFPMGTIWLDESTSAVYMLVKFTGGQMGVTATWTQLASGSTGTVSLIGNTGTADEDNLGNINVPGQSPNIITTGNNINTLTIALSDTPAVNSIDLPDTTASFGAGFISFNGVPAFHNYASGASKTNMFVGRNAGNATGTGASNSSLGSSALRNFSTGSFNCALGTLAGQNITSSSSNNVVGAGALQQLTTGLGSNNVVGTLAGAGLSTGAFNLLLGDAAGSSYTSNESSNILLSNLGTVAESNTIRIGTQGSGNDQQNRCFIAGIWNTNIDPTNQAVLIDANGQLGTGPAGTVTFDNIDLPNTDPSIPEGYINFGGNRFIHNLGVSNTFVGENSGNTTLTGSASVALGTNVLQALTTGDGNTVLGAGSGSAITTGDGNTIVGAGSTGGLTTATGNTFIGSSIAASSVVTGDANAALGSSCFAALTSGQTNIAIGARTAGASLDQITTGSFNIALNGGTSLTGSDSSNICIGHPGVLGDNNVMRLGLDGNGNEEIEATFIAGQVTTSRSIIAATGNVQTDDGNMIIGSTSNNADANAMIFLKQRISSTVQTGDTLGNIDFRGLDGTSYIPAAAISSTVAGTVGVNQVGGTLEFYTTQAIAAAPPSLRMTIDQNGTITTDISGGNTDAIIVSNGDVTLENGDIIIDDGSLTVSGATSIVTFSNVPGTVIANDVQLLIDSVSGELGTTSSSRRYKDNIVDMGNVSSPIMQLRPVTFTMKADKSNQLRYGLIAEEVHDVMPNIVGYHKDGQPEYVRYHDLPCMLLNELQKQQRVIADLLNRIKILESLNSAN